MNAIKEGACRWRERANVCQQCRTDGRFRASIGAPDACPHGYTPENLPRKSFGLGDAVASIATPIARALGLPCIDPATKDLRPESKCAERKAALNKLTA